MEITYLFHNNNVTADTAQRFCITFSDVLVSLVVERLQKNVPWVGAELRLPMATVVVFHIEYFGVIL